MEMGFRIRRLYLENVVYFYTGMSKTKIDLDLSDADALINVIIGQMGTGKSALLGHLQPYHNFGVLDERNSDKMITSEKDGKKIIEYEDIHNEYIIRHEYIWTGKTHSVKSYFEKNGVELNENGNQSSFKEIVKIEFGIDQSFLRLIRIGSNVTNLIDMKSTERKTYVADLLRDTETYLFFYKKWNEELRDANAKLSVLINKLNNISTSDVSAETLEVTIEDYREKETELSMEIKDLESEYYKLSGMIESMLEGKSITAFGNHVDFLELELKKNKDGYTELEEKIKEITCDYTIEEVSKIIGQLEAENRHLIVQIEKSSKEYEDKKILLNNLRDKLRISKNNMHLQTLKEEYEDLSIKEASMRQSIRGLQCNMSSNDLIRLHSSLEEFNAILYQIIQFNHDDVMRVYDSDSSIRKWADTKVQILTGAKVNLQKKKSMLEYSQGYQVPGLLYRPPMCPTKSCPYYAKHPHTIQKGRTKTDFQLELEAINMKIEGIEIDINRYSDYSVLYQKIIGMKDFWKNLYRQMLDININTTTSLRDILKNAANRKWYDYDKLMDILERVKIREQYGDIMNRMGNIRLELKEMEGLSGTDIETQIEVLEKDTTTLLEDINTMDINKKKVVEDMQAYNEIYESYSMLHIWEKQLAEYTSRNNDLEKSIAQGYQAIDTAMRMKEKMDTISIKLVELKKDLSDITTNANRLTTVLNDIRFTKEEYDRVIQEKEYLTYMVKATSSKDGIPLEMVKSFINDCVFIINDMVQDIFDDDIEIIRFDISEDFTIPYKKNGEFISDVSKASQGQKSILSLAISFAIVQKTMQMYQNNGFIYNIPLLDEPDGALYKNDRMKFIAILMKHAKAINSSQIFLITHNSNFSNYNVGVITTSDEVVDLENVSYIKNL